MGRFAKPVYKWDENGKLVTKYPSVANAIYQNGITSACLEWSIQHGTMARGYYYTKTEVKPVLTGLPNPKNIRKIMAERNPKNETPWCGADGFFDIDGWAKVMRVEPNSEDKRSIVIDAERHLPKKYAGKRA